MSNADERLIVMLEARIAEFEKRMQQAERRGERTYTGLRGRSKTATQAMEADMKRASTGVNQSLASVTAGVGKFAAAFGVGFLAGGAVAALEGIARAGRETIRAIAEIGDEAKRAGVAVEAFQEWRYVAEQNRISFDALTDGFKEMNLRADEFVQTGAGPAAEAFARLGFNAEQVAEQLKDPSAMMLEIIGRLEGMEQAAQIRIADELFGGTGGERFVELLEQGQRGIEGQIERARELGLVMDADMIQKAQDLDARFNEVSARLTAVWRAGVVGAAEFFGFIEEERAKLDLVANDAERVIGEVLAGQLQQQAEVAQETVEIINSLGSEYENLGAEAAALSVELNNAALAMQGLGNTEAAAELTRLSAELGEASRGFEDGTLSGDQFAEKLGEVVENVDLTVSAMDELDRASLGGVISSVQSLLGWIQALPEAVAIARDEIRSLEGIGGSASFPGKEADDMGVGAPVSPLAPSSSPRSRKAPALLGEPEAAGNGRGGRGGGGSPRIEALLEELATEREIVTAWYEESLELINGATDAQLEAIGGRHEALERLEAEHLQRLAGMRDQSNNYALEGASAFFGALATVAAAGGDKFLRVARVAAAAEGLINSYVAYTAVLRDPLLPWFARIPAAASVLAAGLGMVSAIKGGGGSSVGASAGVSASQVTRAQPVRSARPAAEPAQTATRTQEAQPMRVLLQGIDPGAIFTGQVLIDLADGLQKEFGNRGVILGVAR